VTAAEGAIAVAAALAALVLAGLLRSAPALIVVLALELLAVRTVPELAPFGGAATMLAVALLCAGGAWRAAPAGAVTAWRLAGAGPVARFVQFRLPGLAMRLGAALAGALLAGAG
jgi:hypothetical protein